MPARMTLVLMLLLGLIMLLTVAVWSSARTILQPPRMTQGKAFYLLQRVTPNDLGLKFQPVNFHVRDSGSGPNLKLVGWWMPHPAGGSKTAILIHGYADAKVGAIAWAPLWQQLGYNVLAYDGRAHGESEGRYCSGGVHERDDLSQIINELRQQWPAASETVVLFGISLGASPALAVAAERSDIYAVVAECPFSNYTNAVTGLAKQLSLPMQSFLPVTLRVAGWLAKADLHRVDNLPLMREARCPIFAIEAGVDPYVPANDAIAVESAIRERHDLSQFWRVEGATHLRAIEADPAAYLKRLADFLDSLSPND